MAGYSGTPLPQKLGLKAGQRVLLLGAPAGFMQTLGVPPAGVTLNSELGRGGPFDLIVWFVNSQRELVKGFARAAKKLDPNGGLWVGWPKKSSGVTSDMTEDAVRAVALPAGLVNNKVCAIDETWSGLRCVIRLENRPKPTRSPPPPKKAKRK